MMEKAFRIAVLMSVALFLVSGTVMAKQHTDFSESIRVQDEGDLPFDKWYEPDETVDTDQGGQEDRADVPEAPENNSREAPAEDTRPQGR